MRCASPAPVLVFFSVVSQVEYGNEFFMVNRAFKAIRRADVVLLMVDVEAGITDQVKHFPNIVQHNWKAQLWCVTREGYLMVFSQGWPTVWSICECLPYGFAVVLRCTVSSEMA